LTRYIEEKKTGGKKLDGSIIQQLSLRKGRDSNNRRYFVFYAKLKV